MGLFGTAFKALGWGFSTNFKHIGRWLLLTILSIIPIINFFADGAILKILKGEEPAIAPAGKSFLSGLLWFIIFIIYQIIPLIVFFVISGASLLPLLSSGGANLGAAITAGVFGVGTILFIVLEILFCLIMVPAMINYVRSGCKFGKAFAFSEIFALIKKTGWGKYILAIIVNLIMGILLGIVIGLICMIPILGLIILILAFIPIVCFDFKYWNDVFA